MTAMTAIAALIGLVYGAVFPYVYVFVEHRIRRLWGGFIVPNICAAIVSAFFLLSLLLFNPFVKDWSLFTKIWIIGFLAGALAYKFLRARK